MYDTCTSVHWYKVTTNSNFIMFYHLFGNIFQSSKTYYDTRIHPMWETILPGDICLQSTVYSSVFTVEDLQILCAMCTDLLGLSTTCVTLDNTKAKTLQSTKRWMKRWVTLLTPLPPGGNRGREGIGGRLGGSWPPAGLQYSTAEDTSRSVAACNHENHNKMLWIVKSINIPRPPMCQV